MASKIGNLLLSLYRPFFYVNVALNTFVLGSTTIFVSVFDPRGNAVHYIGKLWSRMNLFFTGVRVRMHGLENIECGRPYIVMANHQSHFDVWALIAWLPLQLRWVMKKELRKVPVFGYGCERMGHIYVDRGKSESAKRSLEVAGKKIRAGSSVVFFPEGTRGADGKLLPFKKGGFVVALAAGVPILPITINGSRAILPRGTTKFRPGVIDVTIHPAVSVEGFTYETRQDLLEKVRAVIQSGLR
jgi:1-acyl-sn-glycerol-3-phosphate acyltransferase